MFASRFFKKPYLRRTGEYGRRLGSCISLYRACSRALDRGLHKPVVIAEKIDPRKCGARRTLGSPRKGKIADYELPIPPCMRCHIVSYQDRVELHVDRVSPLCDPLIHLVTDASRDFVLATTTIALALLGLLGSGVSTALLAALTTYLAARMPP